MLRRIYCYLLFWWRVATDWLFTRWTGHTGLAQLDDISVLYKTADFLIVNKHYDVKINSNSPTDSVTVETQLRHLFPEVVDSKCCHGFRFVHRLDYATSGVLCLALTKKGAKWATKAFMQRTATKHYLALVRGHVLVATGQQIEINVPIGRDSSVDDFRKMCTIENPACVQPQSANTELILLEHGYYDGDPASKVLLIPHTGRTHQLRIHCCHIGHQIVGDYTYSDRRDVKPHRTMLHAHRLVLPLSQLTIDVIAGDEFLQQVDPKWSPRTVFITYDEFISRPNERSRSVNALIT